MKIDLDHDIKNLNGEILKDSNMAVIAANYMVARPDGNAIKILEIAQKLNKDKKIEVDTSDYNLIKEIFEKEGSMNILARGQILKQIMEAKK